MAKAKTYTFFSDAGHGWLRVPVKELEDLGLVDKITPYSYLNGGNVYLEEDVDYSTFVAAMKEAGIEFRVIEKRSERSSIRNLPSFRDGNLNFFKAITVGLKVYLFTGNGTWKTEAKIVSIKGDKVVLENNIGIQFKAITMARLVLGTRLELTN